MTIQVTIAKDGSWFKSDGDVVYYNRAWRRRDILKYIVNKSIHRVNATPYLKVYESVWNGEGGPRLNSDRIQYVRQQVNYIRDDGLRDVILTKNGIGYYIAQDIKITLSDRNPPKRKGVTPGIILPNSGSMLMHTRETAKEKHEERAEINQLKHITKCLIKCFDKKDAPNLYWKLKASGFRNSHIAKMFGVSRAAVQYWEKTY